MTVEGRKVSIGGQTRDVVSLPFMANGEVTEVSDKGVITVVNGDYTFTIDGKSIGYRHKPKGKSVANPMKRIMNFKQLDSLPLSDQPKAVATTTQTRVVNAEEDSVMVKAINLGAAGKLDLTAEETAAVKKVEKNKEVLEVGEFDALVSKVKGEADIATVTALQTRVDATIDAHEAAQKPAETANPVTNTQTPGTEPAKEAGTAAGLTPAEVFANAGGNIGETTEEQKIERKDAAPKRTLTKAERELRDAEAERENKAFLGLIDDATEDLETIKGGADATEALKKLILIDNRVPLYKTLVQSDTRLQPKLINHVKAADRKYHPSRETSAANRETGRHIPLRDALGDYELILTESNPSPPRGFFIYVPKGLLDFKMDAIATYTERNKVIKALEAFEDDESKERVIKYFSKNDFVRLLLLLGGFSGVVVQEYECNNTPKDHFVETAPTIALHSKRDSQEVEPTFSLKASLGSIATKISIRNFIPLYTYDTVKASQADKELTTRALFDKLVFTKPKGYPEAKYHQLQQASKAMFIPTETGYYEFADFKDKYVVPAYDAKKDTVLAQTQTLFLPKAEWSQPTSGSPRPRLKRSKHNEEGGNYNATYRPFVERVGSQIDSARPRTATAKRDDAADRLAQVIAQNNIFKGDPINIR